MSIEAPESVNGQAQIALVRVRFGPRPNQTVPLDWAEWMVTEWRNAERNGGKPPKFSDILQRATLHFLMEDE